MVLLPSGCGGCLASGLRNDDKTAAGQSKKPAGDNGSSSAWEET
ncbi:MAG: hypothetical protein ACM3TR_01665 [Caulobacteraceae bacterium]